MSKVVQPSIDETAFNCPHCFTLTTQHWFQLRAMGLPEKVRTPPIITEELRRSIVTDVDMTEDVKRSMLKDVDELLAGLVLITKHHKDPYTYETLNLHLSKCYNCEKIAVWIHERLVFPASKIGVHPNLDLPSDITHDFEEARDILIASPRGAAALLRLCLQKLCKHLGEEGKSIDADIASLVKKGLNPLVQQALDIVRVIGNEAVHPGTMDLKDDQATALQLLELVNSIAQQMISHPKSVSAMYATLPEAKRKGIEARDKKTSPP